MKSKTALCRLDLQSYDFELWDNLTSSVNGSQPARIHELCITTEGMIYFAENDNHLRSSYLWSARLI